MTLKEIEDLKKKMMTTCNKSINGIIEQLLYNENDLKALKVQADAGYKPTNLNIYFKLKVEDKNDSSKTLQILCNPIIDLPR